MNECSGGWHVMAHEHPPEDDALCLLICSPGGVRIGAFASREGSVESMVGECADCGVPVGGVFYEGDLEIPSEKVLLWHPLADMPTDMADALTDMAARLEKG